MSNPKTITIDDVSYVRADSAQPATNTEGLNYAVVRSRDQGVMAGYVQSVEGQTVTLLCARQLWQWHTNGIALADLANEGVGDPKKCRFSSEMLQPCVMTEACGVMYCTDSACRSIRGQESYRNG